MLGEWIRRLDAMVWGWPMIGLLMGTHVYMTVRTGGIQRQVLRGIRLSVTRDSAAQGDVSQFGALVTSLCSTIGTGNILGVGTAIALGGPGAVLWMWLTGIFGMATKYAETLLAVRYRVRTGSGSMLGGAMYVLERGLHMRRMGIAFGVLGAVCAFGTGCTVQAGAAASGLRALVPLPLPAAGLILCALTGLCILRGIRSIARVAEKLVPAMAAFYVAGCAAILIRNHGYLGQTAALILGRALDFRAAGGGIAGSAAAAACRFGVARGLFSNESGMGSAPLAAASAKTANPKRQALVSMTGTFWDTGVICLMTALALVSEMLRNPSLCALPGTALAAGVFSALPGGDRMLSAALSVFAFTTILGWYYYGERCAVYLLGERCILGYKCLWIAGVFAGALAETELIWSLAELLNGLMAVPNLLGVLLLGGEVARETRRFRGDRLEQQDDRSVPRVESLRGALGKE